MRCPNCGMSNPNDAPYCHNCGDAFPEPEKKKTDAQIGNPTVLRAKDHPATWDEVVLQTIFFGALLGGAMYTQFLPAGVFNILGKMVAFLVLAITLSLFGSWKGKLPQAILLLVAIGSVVFIILRMFLA